MPPRKSPLKMYRELQAQNAAAKGGDATIGGKLAIRGRSNGSAKAGAKVEDLKRGALKMPAGDAEKMKAEFNARKQLQDALAKHIAAASFVSDVSDAEAAQVPSFSPCFMYVLAACHVEHRIIVTRLRLRQECVSTLLGAETVRLAMKCGDYGGSMGNRGKQEEVVLTMNAAAKDIMVKALVREGWAASETEIFDRVFDALQQAVRKTVLEKLGGE